MKKFLLTFSVFILALSVAFAQEATTPPPAANNNAQETTTDNNTVKAVEKYAPTFGTIRSLDNKNVDANFSRLKTNIYELETDYLFRVQYKADKILGEYTNAKFIDTNNAIFTYTYYYDIIAKTLADDNNLNLAMAKIDQGFAILKDTTAVMTALGRTNEVVEAEYKLNLLGGMFSIYVGSIGKLKNSLNYFETIINKKLTSNTDDLIMIHNYAASVANMLVNKQDDGFAKRYYYNKLFDNLWQYITLSTEEGEARDIKYKIIIEQYNSVVYVGTPIFENTYAAYFDKFGIPYEKPEDKKDSNVAATTTTPAATETTPATTTTPEAAAQ